jgi:uncharacterized protein YbjT (DUF2867 family)
MKIVVIGGTGLIGSKLVNKLSEQGHDALAASLDTGVNTLTGEGLDEALAGAAVVVDVSNAPSWEDAAVMNFFRTATGNLLAAETAAGVAHHVALSVVGTERLIESGYFRAKLAQEELITASSIPYSLVRATQFFEFVSSIADDAAVGNTVRLPPALIQPMAADDVAAAVGRVAVGAPLDGMAEVGGPEQFRLDELIRGVLAKREDPREVVTDAQARYFGINPGERVLLPGADAHLADMRFGDWSEQQLATA